MAEYVKLINKELRSSAATPPHHASPPTSASPQETALSALEMSRLTLWNLYNNNTPVAPPPPTAAEPQKEALNLEVREQQARAMQDVMSKRESDESLLPPPAKRLLAEEDPVKPYVGGWRDTHQDRKQR
ncbi:unnamed protein product [Timema podura]|uniref:Uncharacterized protein n=1 Tax=Timema podura TaxID=61482 RepID=A0ABN7PJH4_TIMPD|nr:unnamed protein product [Timema podura]